MDFKASLQNATQHFTLKQEKGTVVGSIIAFRTFFNQFSGIDHPQGYGKLIKVSCDVIFEYIIPIDINKTPWILLVSTGIHSHQPPPPVKTPIAILNGLIKVIKRLSSPVITNSKYPKAVFNVF